MTKDIKGACFLILMKTPFFSSKEPSLITTTTTLLNGLSDLLSFSQTLCQMHALFSTDSVL